MSTAPGRQPGARAGQAAGEGQRRGRTMREELAEHEGVVGLGVVLRQAHVLVHVERDDVFEPTRAALDSSPHGVERRALTRACPP